MKEQNFIPNCDFSFQCSLDWDELENTEDPNRRFCKTCQQQVWYIKSNAELEIARLKGYCVAMKLVEPHIELIEPQQQPKKIQMGVMRLPFHLPPPNGRELLEIGDRLSHHLHQEEFKLTLELLTSLKSDFNVNWVKKCHERVLKEIANILETGNTDR